MLRGSDFYDFLFVNSIHSNIKYCFFSIKLIHTIIIREGYGYFYFISWVSTYELIFKVINIACLLYTSDAADEEDSVDLGGCRINKKKKTK